MKKIKTTLLAITMGTVCFGAMSISATESEEKNIMVQIHRMQDSNTKIDLDVNGQAEVFSLPELQVGETEEITTESGNNIFVARTESGYSVTVGDEEINLPQVGGEMFANIERQGIPLHRNVNNQIQVIGDLTEEQIAIIKDGFAAAGVAKEIEFSKGHEMKFITIGDHSGNYEVEVDGHADLNTWVTTDGDKHQVKVIKMGDKAKHLEYKSEIIVIESEEESDN